MFNGWITELICANYKRFLLIVLINLLPDANVVLFAEVLSLAAGVDELDEEFEGLEAFVGFEVFSVFVLFDDELEFYVLLSVLFVSDVSFDSLGGTSFSSFLLSFLGLSLSQSDLLDGANLSHLFLPSSTPAHPFSLSSMTFLTISTFSKNSSIEGSSIV
jgi:hypothetical protein